MRLTKHFKKVIAKTKLIYEELVTLIAEVEAIINSRPLSFVSPLDVEEPLTPSHLLLGRRILSLPDDYIPRPSNDEDYVVTPERLTRRLSFLKMTLDHFWNRWRKEYLGELRSIHAAKSANRRAGTTIAEGDIVVIHDGNEKCSFWRLSVIEDLIPGRDGLVRGAQVRVSVKSGKTAVWKRPVERLYPLEVHCSADPTNIRKDLDDGSCPLEECDKDEQSEAITRRTEEMIDGPSRPRRQAAIQALDRINCMKDLDLV